MRRPTDNGLPVDPAGAHSPSQRTDSAPSANLRWLTIDADDTPEHPGLINDLIAKRIDGMTVKGVFDQASIDAALSFFASVPDAWGPQAFGGMLGMPLYQGGANSQDRNPHIEIGARSRELYRRGFGFDPHARLKAVLEPMAGHLEIVAPTEDGRSYNPGNIRRYDPGLGGLKAHAGNEFVELIKHGAVSHLLTTTHVVDHMSYFVVLQPSEIGGSLSVFDLLWDQYVHADEKWAGARDDGWIESIPALRLSPGPGDLILFGGGWRWHRVDEIGGRIPRFTYGGFAGPSRDGTQLHLFS